MSAPARLTRRPLSVAPMMDRTDRHFRVMMRHITRHTLLYTEMVTAAALTRGDARRLLAYDPVERPLALQLGGEEVRTLTECARLAWDFGFDEVNLNVGCPSDRVQSGAFGACLMLRPERVAEAVAAMRAAVPLPVTVKHRIGVDDRDQYEHLLAFVDTVAEAGCDRFTVHARKAWLSGLSPKQNRELPPLRPEEVYRLKAERPALEVELNGGVHSLAEARAHLARVDAVMIGRAAWDDPLLFAQADAELFGAPPAALDLDALVTQLEPYVAARTLAGERFAHLTRPLLNLFTGAPGARRWRRELCQVGEVRGVEAARALRRAWVVSQRGGPKGELAV